MTNELLACDIVAEEIERWHVIIGWDKMTCFWNCEIVKVGALAPITTYNLTIVTISTCGAIDPIDLASLAPKVFTTFKSKATEPVFLSFWSILSIKFTSINQNW